MKRMINHEEARYLQNAADILDGDPDSVYEHLAVNGLLVFSDDGDEDIGSLESITQAGEQAYAKYERAWITVPRAALETIIDLVERTGSDSEKDRNMANILAGFLRRKGPFE